MYKQLTIEDLDLKPSNLSFADTVRELQSGNYKVPVDPKYLEPLKKTGMLNTGSTSEAYVEKIFEERKREAVEIDKQLGVPLLPDFPQAALANEMRECMIFGLNGAAITLGAILIEATIKSAIARKLAGITRPLDAGIGDIYQVEIERLERKDFGKAIEEAFRLSLITLDMRERLHHFRGLVRNPYMHFNQSKIMKAAKVKLKHVPVQDAKTGETKYMDLDMSEQPGLWQLGKKFVDKDIVVSVYKFAIEVAWTLYGQKNPGK
jgi:hypothetical protein